MVEELVRLRRRIRVLVVLLVVAATIAAYGWVRRPSDSEPISIESAEDVERLRKRISEASHGERLRLLHELGRARGQQASTAIIELLRNAHTLGERRLAIVQLGQLGSVVAVRELAELARSTTERRELRRAAIDALGSCRSEPGRDQLLALLEASSETPLAGLRTHIISALGRVGGERVVQQLVELCNDRDVRQSERRAAIYALGQSGDAETLPVLLALTKSEQQLSLRQAAVTAVGSLGTDTAKRTLIRLVQSGPRELKPAAVKALSQFDGDDVQVLIASASGSDDGALSAAALEALGADHPLAQEALSAALASSKQETRRAAVRALGKSASAEAATKLSSLLDDRDVASEAAYQLANLATPEARQALLSAAQSDAPVTAQLAALSALSQLQGEDVQQALGELVKGGSPRVAARALEQLAQQRGPEAKETLLAAYRDGNQAVRSAALGALVDLRDPETKQLLMQAAQSGDYSQSYEAITGLLKVAPDEAPTLLSNLLKNGPSSAKTTAAQQLGRLGGPQARSALLATLKDKDANVNVAWAIGQLRDETTRRELRNILDDPTLSARVKQQALVALQYSGDRQGLLAAANHPDKQIASAALTNLGNIGGGDVERTLLDALGSGDSEKKRSAVSALARTGTPEAVKALGQALHDKDAFHGALSGLTRIGGKQALGAISEMYQSSEPEKRRNIVAYLQNAHGGHARALLETALGDDDEQVVAAAASALANRPAHRNRILSLMQSSPSQRVRYAIARHFSYDPATYKRYKTLVDEIIRQGSS